MIQNSEEKYNRAIYTALRIGFIALLFIWSFEIVKPFILPVLWGVIISIAVYPLHIKFANKLGGRQKLSATIITLVFLFFLVAPSIILIESTVDSARHLSENIQAGTSLIPPPSKNVINWRIVGKPIYDTWMLASSNMEGLIRKFTPQLKQFAPSIISEVSSLVTNVMLLLFSVIIGGALLTQDKTARTSANTIFTSLIGKQGESFVTLSILTIRSVVQGVIGVAVIQSFLAGIGFWAIDMPVAGLWSFFIFVLAILQLPALIVLGPLVVYAFSFADTTPAIIFAVWSIIVGLSDNILRPLLLGRGVDVPMLVVLVGAIGGMMMSGIIGLFVGAVVLAISYKVFQALFINNVHDENTTEEE